MTPGFNFAPDAEDAARCDRAMHGGLADSLRQICAASAGKVDFDRRAIERLADAADAGRRLRPVTFGVYYELVPALLSGERDEAERLFAALAHERPIEAPFQILALGDAELADRADRYLRHMNEDSDHQFQFLPPSREELAAFHRQFASVLELLRAAAPELVAEIEALICELILVVGPERTKSHFDGGSSYQLWGALFLNAVRHKTRVDVIESLAHESAHSRLFGLCIDEAAIKNADDERYASPLRPEPRPMDGVYHATFVSARMHWAMSRLIDSGLLSDEERALAITARDADRVNFEKGYATVAAHAQLTETGRRAITAARDYMTQAA